MPEPIESGLADLIYDGPEGIVVAYAGFEEDLTKADMKYRARVLAILENQFCEFGEVADSTSWRSEGRHKVGNQKVLVQAVKGGQCRVYGVIGSVAGKKCFFVSATDPKKKQNKADQGLLKQAARVAVEIVQSIEGAKI